MLDLLSFGWLLTSIVQDGQALPFLLPEFHERKIQYLRDSKNKTLKDFKLFRVLFWNGDFFKLMS